MRRPVLSVSLAVFVLTGLIAAALFWPAKNSLTLVISDSQGVETTEVALFHANYRATLERNFAWNYVDLELKSVAEDLEQRLGLPTRLDQRGMDEVGVAGTSKATIVATNLSARSALEIMLEPLGLTHLPFDGYLHITNPDSAQRPERLITRVYPVPDLRRPRADLGRRWKVDHEPLIQLITNHIDPPSWSDVGGPCAITLPDNGSLIINQSLEGHERISFLLDALRRIDRDHAANPRTVEHPLVSLQPRELRPRLDARHDFEFDGALDEWAAAVSKAFGLHVQLDRPALEEVGVKLNDKIAGQVRDRSLLSTLRHFLAPHGLSYLVRRDYILITNPDAACRPTNLLGAAFPVWDLATSMAPDARLEELDKLQSSLEEIVAPADWTRVGGPGSCEIWLKPATLVIAQTEQNLERVAQVLEQIRRSRRMQRGN